MPAVPYSEVGPIERQEPIVLVGDAMRRLVKYRDQYICGHRKCGSILGIDTVFDLDRPLGQRTLGFLHCMADRKHRGIRKPRPIQKPYGLAGTRESEPLTIRRESV